MLGMVDSLPKGTRFTEVLQVKAAAGDKRAKYPAASPRPAIPGLFRD